MRVITTENKPIKMWLENIEDGALAQAKNLANLPFVYKHIAIMPDSHQGYGMPIGGVMATKGVVIPNAVGVDIGCGMCAIKTSLKSDELSKDRLRKIISEIKEVIPVGFNKHKEPQDSNLIKEMEREYDCNYGTQVYGCPVISDNFNMAFKSLGTLGGGNHFIEIQKGDDDCIWIMIHSGSRKLGLEVAKYYNDLAKELNEKWFSSIPKAHDLAFLPLNSDEGQAYLKEMNYCVDYALANRKLMMDRIKEVLSNNFSNIEFHGEMINIAHNYARLENHGENVVVHRKGATSARIGEVGIIPGSQGTYSYIVEGLGNKQSFESCSHGAGRVLGRKAAQRELSLEEEIQKLDNMGVIHGMTSKKDLDESVSCYKDIDEVMKNQEDLVRILVKLTPLGVIKG